MDAGQDAKTRGYRDLHEHLKALDEAGLLWTIDQPVDKDSELHPLVRWQVRGGIAEKDRKAFLFTNVVDAKGRKYDMPVVVGALAGGAWVKGRVERASAAAIIAAHQDCTVAVGRRIVETVQPLWLRIGGYWYPRGGIPIDVFYQSGPAPEGLWVPDQGVPAYRGR